MRLDHTLSPNNQFTPQDVAETALILCNIYLTLIEAEDIPIALYPKGVPEDAQLTFKEFSTALYDTLMEFLASRGTGGKAERVLVRDSLKLLFIAMDSQEVAGVVAEAAQIVGRKK